MKSRLFLVALAASLLTVAAPREFAQETFPLEIFGRYLEPLVEQIGMPGVSAAIIQGGANPNDVTIRKYYNIGYADLEKKIPTRSDTPYPIGGVTQAMTGVLHGVC